MRSVGYGLPEFLDSRAPDKVLRIAVAHRLAQSLVSEARKEVDPKDGAEKIKAPVLREFFDPDLDPSAEA